jgi:hypothetical protein
MARVFEDVRQVRLGGGEIAETFRAGSMVLLGTV